ncbi:MAG TPA: PHP-associated domain-containing protein [Candidatus Polarisedimenticolia bacterium]|nr:PHP-associated domain-containing protein [Candidatus Polarisedimenticolia bacterium]
MSRPDEGVREMRVDLHVHTWHSRLCKVPVLCARDCYSPPLEVYRKAKSKGMDLVTFTDHDTIDGCLELLSMPGCWKDFFISEEVSTRDPRTGCRFHVSVFGINERQHREIERLRPDMRELAAYLTRESVPAALNHVGSSVVGRRLNVDALLDVAAAFSLLETRNGAQILTSNAAAEMLVRAMEAENRRVGTTGGSDAHTPRRIARTWTTASAHDRESFLRALRSGEVRPEGISAGILPLIRDVYEIVGKYYKDLLWNEQRRFSREERRRAAACALVSLPLHLIALPVTGTLYRLLRVRAAARNLTRALVYASREGARMEPSETEEAVGLSAGA